MQNTINKIMASNVGELHSDLANIKKKIKQNAINLINIYGEVECEKYSYIEVSTKGKFFITSNNIRVGGCLYYNKNEDYLDIAQYEYIDENITTDEEIGCFPFDELDIDIQISILDEIVKSYIPPQDLK